ncbi:MAG: RNA polymerase-associated protein RapA [Pseudomonadales bacterium]
MEFVLGQRWVSQTESELGLGMVVEIEGRHVTVQFPATEEERVYAVNNSPLVRVIYQSGETLHDQAQTPLAVQQVEDLDGLKCYLVTDPDGREFMLPETQISALVHLTSPSQRLLSGQFDKSTEFQLRVASLYHHYELQQSMARGMLGPRTSLLSHQLYIAHEVASRFAPRVLLADEVGLGKTIEAGMILHRQLQTGLASRVLIVVPDALLHQWLVEMLRKFGLKFSLLDRERYQALIETGEANPFETEQLVLCGLSLLLEQDGAVEQAELAGWDLLVVDEAHHLVWSAEQPSPEYAAIETLAQACAGLLLLTATPEQLGVESHFARLRLLDPARFSELADFIEEQTHYAELNDIVQALLADESLTDAQTQYLTAMEVEATERDALIEQLLDQHGTGRVLFRNTRAAIAGFPKRLVHSHRLQVADDGPSFSGLQPEQALRDAGIDWLSCDPRVSWLEGFLAQHREHKVLVICATAQTAIDLEKHLHLNIGVRSAAFYEDLSIIERDRAAAYFADPEAGAQTLICSEIGSEGRNFQFAHHLVLLDLPLNPDLLEQRIGRLDRIGQTSDIEIHVPYIANTAQEVLFRWYHEGLSAFTESFAGGSAVLREFGPTLTACISGATPPAEQEVSALIEQTAAFTARLKEELQQGRDRLLELNSHKPEVAAEIIEFIEQTDADDSLPQFLSLACETFGVELEAHSDEAMILKPTEHMLTHAFPEVGDDGLTVTFNRDHALVREDMAFLTWESPIVTGLLELVLGSELGNTNISTMALKALPAGTLLVEYYFTMHVSAPRKYQIGRFLPATPVRMLLDANGRDLAAAVNHEALNARCQHVKKSTRPAIIKEIRAPLVSILEKAANLAASREEALKSAARARVADIVGTEATRLRQLQKVNPAIRDEEIQYFVEQQEAALAHIANASLEPQAARVIITT